MNEDSRVLARRYLRGLLAVVLDTKSSIRKNGLYLDLLVQPTRNLISKQSQQLLNAFNIIYPKVGVNEDNVDIHLMKGKAQIRYQGYIRIPFEQLLRFREHLSPLNFEVHIDPIFSYQYSPNLRL